MTRLPDSYSYTLARKLTERELVSIWRQNKKGEWIAVRFVASRAQ